MAPISRIRSQAQAREEQTQADKLKQRAARQAALKLREDVEVPTVECLILPAGDGRVSMGEHFAAIGDAHYEEGETATLELPVALSLYLRGYVNFEGAKQALEEQREAERKRRLEEAEARRRAAEDAEIAA